MKTSQNVGSLRTQTLLRCRGTALSDLLLIITATAILASIILTSLTRTKSRIQREECLKNVGKLSTVFQIWLHDYEDRMPWTIPTKDGGSWGEPAVYSHWKRMSNYMGTARILMCPTLAKYRIPVDRMNEVTQDLNVAYAIGLDSAVVQPSDANTTKGLAAGSSILVSDMDLSPDVDQGKTEICGRAGGIRTLYFGTIYGKPEASGATWSKTNHHPFGQIGTADGSAASLDNVGLRRQMSLMSGGSQGFHLLPPDMEKRK